MNTIDTSHIIDPNQDQPLYGKSLAFLQASTSTQLRGLAWSLIGSSLDTSKSYVISGLQPFGTNQYGIGYVLYNDELFYCQGKSTTTAFVNVPVLNVSDVSDNTIDPTQFSNGVNFNVHRVRTMVLSDAISGSGTVDLSACIYLSSPWINIPSYDGAWVNAGTQVGRYKKEGNYIVLSGFLDNVASPLNAAAFTLPVGFRPFKKKVFICGDITGVSYNFVSIETTGVVTINVIGTSGVCLDEVKFPLD